MTTTLPVSRIINVAVNLTPQGAQFPNLSTCLVLGTSAVIDTVTRLRTYNTLAAVAADFGTSAEEYLAAAVWFGQSPQPTSLSIGRWIKTAAAGQLICGGLTTANSLLSAWTGITTGSLKIAVDGGSATNVTALDFHLQTTLNGVASVIQAGVQALGGSYSAVTCVYNSVYNRFVFTSGTTGGSSAVAFLTAAGSGVDITGMLMGLSTSAGAYVANGVAAETAIASVTLFDTSFGGMWYALFVCEAVDADHVAIASYIEAASNPHFYWINTQEVQVLALGDTTHIGYLLQQLAFKHCFWQYSSTSLYAVLSAAALMATVNWLGQLTAITLMYKQEPGITPESLTTTQANALESYNGNVFVNYANGTAILETGVTPSGLFADEIIGIDWLRGYIQTNVYNLLYSVGKVPQTDPGVNAITTVINSACSQGVVNGLLAPGTWTAAGFGQLVMGQWLDKGFYVYVPSVASQTPTQRATRTAPTFQIAAKTAGAVHDVQITLNVQQ